MDFDMKSKVYKKKNPRAPFIKQIILYSIMLILCIALKQWKIALVFIGLIAFSAFMLYKKRDAQAHSLAEYIHSYDDEFPVENPNAKETKREEKSKRKQEYEDYIARVEEEYDNFDYGDEYEDDEDDE